MKMVHAWDGVGLAACQNPCTARPRHLQAVQKPCCKCRNKEGAGGRGVAGRMLVIGTTVPGARRMKV